MATTMIVLLLLPLLARTRSQSTRLPSGDTPSTTTPRRPPTPEAPMCSGQDHCNTLAQPCEVRTCSPNGLCEFFMLLPKEAQCVGPRYVVSSGCFCDGESPQCPTCDFSFSRTDIGIIAGSTAVAAGNTPPTTTAPSAGVTELPGSVNVPPPVTTVTTQTTGTSTDSSATLLVADPVMENSTTRTKAGSTFMTPPTPTRGMTMSAETADDVQHDTEQPLIPIVVGSVVGCVLLLGLIAAIAYFVSRRSRGSMSATPHASQSMPSPSSSSSIMAPSTSEYGAAPIFPPSGEYGVAPAQQQPYDAPPSQMFANYESVRDPLQL
jgi:hypothetical protein